MQHFGSSKIASSKSLVSPEGLTGNSPVSPSGPSTARVRSKTSYKSGTRQSCAPLSNTMKNINTKKTVTSDKTSPDGWTEVKSRSRKPKVSKNKRKNTRRNTRSKSDKTSPEAKSKSDKTSPDGWTEVKSRSRKPKVSKNKRKNTRRNTRSKSKSKSKSDLIKDAKNLKAVVRKLINEFNNLTKRSESGKPEEIGRILLYLLKAKVGNPGLKIYYVGEEKMQVDMGSIGDLVEAIFSYTHLNLKEKIQDRMQTFLNEAMHMLLSIRNMERYSPHSIKKGKGMWKAEIVGNDLVMDVTPDNLEFILDFLTEEKNMRLLLGSCPEMWDTLTPISIDTTNLGGSFHAFCMRLFAQALAFCANRTRSGVVFRAVAPGSTIMDFFFGDFVHPTLKPAMDVDEDGRLYEVVSILDSVLSNIRCYPIPPPRKVEVVAKVEKKIDITDEDAFPSLGDKVDSKVQTSSAWSKFQFKLTPADVEKIEEYNRQAEAEKELKLKKLELKRHQEKKAREEAEEDNELFQLALDKARDLNDFGHGEVIDPTALAKEARNIYNAWKEEEEEEEYQRELEIERRNMDSWEDSWEDSCED